MNKTTREASSDIWLNAAYDLLVESGIDSVKVMTLANRTGLTRTGFYWHFKDLEALFAALINRWEETNTDNLVIQAAAPARTVTEAMLNVFDCWLDTSLFDAPLDLAIRNWARKDTIVHTRLDRADAQRHDALVNLFIRFGYPPDEAQTRSMTVIYTQVGYFSMRVIESPKERFARIPHYVQVFTGVTPTTSEMKNFISRHT